MVPLKRLRAGLGVDGQLRGDVPEAAAGQPIHTLDTARISAIQLELVLAQNLCVLRARPGKRDTQASSAASPLRPCFQ
jgi:hypothetical protein